MAGIIRLLDRDVLEGPGGQARDLGLASADNRLITDSKAGGNRIKAMSQGGQSGSDIQGRLGKEGRKATEFCSQEKEARSLE